MMAGEKRPDGLDLGSDHSWTGLEVQVTKGSKGSPERSQLALRPRQAQNEHGATRPFSVTAVEGGGARWRQPELGERREQRTPAAAATGGRMEPGKMRAQRIWSTAVTEVPTSRGGTGEDRLALVKDGAWVVQQPTDPLSAPSTGPVQALPLARPTLP